jgi:type IV pilus assembly protein PilP
MQNRVLPFISYFVSAALGIGIAVWITSGLVWSSKSQENKQEAQGSQLQPNPNETQPIQVAQPEPTEQLPIEPQPTEPETQTLTPNESQSNASVPSQPIQETTTETKVQDVSKKSNSLISEDLDTLMAPYNYDVENRRDPFREFRLDLTAEVTEEGVFVGPLRPLQRFDLDMIMPVAIIWDVETPKAMFVDPTNEIHILGKDERIGKNNGYIAAIREGEVIVIETVKRKGQLSFKTSILKIGDRRLDK